MTGLVVSPAKRACTRAGAQSIEILGGNVTMASLVQEIVLSPRSLDLISAVDGYERTLVFPSSNSFIPDFRRDDVNYDCLSIDPTLEWVASHVGLSACTGDACAVWHRSTSVALLSHDAYVGQVG